MRTTSVASSGTGGTARSPVRRHDGGILAGLVVCGQCGSRMQTRHTILALRVPAAWLDYAAPPCQSFAGAPLEQLVRDLVLEVVTPASLELSRVRPKNANANVRLLIVNGGCAWSEPVRNRTARFVSTTRSSRRTVWSADAGTHVGRGPAGSADPGGGIPPFQQRSPWTRAAERAEIETLARIFRRPGNHPRRRLRKSVKSCVGCSNRGGLGRPRLKK